MVNKLVQSGVGQFSINVKSNLKDFYGTLNKSYQTMKELTERKHQLQVDSQQLDRLRDKAQRIAAEMRELRQQKTEIKLGMKGDEVIQRLKKELADVNNKMDFIKKRKLEIKADPSGFFEADRKLKIIEQAAKNLQSQKIAIQTELKNADNTKEQLKNLDKRIASLNRQKLEVEAEIQPIRTANVELHKVDSEIDRINNKKVKVDFTDALGKMSNDLDTIADKVWNVTKKLAGLGTAGVAAIGKFMKESVDAASDLEQNIGGVKKLYGDAADEVINNAKNAYKSAGLSMNDYMQQGTQFSASLVKGFEEGQTITHDSSAEKEKLKKQKEDIEKKLKEIGYATTEIDINSETKYKYVTENGKIKKKKIEDTKKKNELKDYKTQRLELQKEKDKIDEQIDNLPEKTTEQVGGMIKPEAQKKAAEYTDKALIDMSDNINTFGSRIEDVQNAYQGFAKRNYTMLDNLRLGFAGTQDGAIELVNAYGKLDHKVTDIDEVTFPMMIDAIHNAQKAMKISGTTAKEAATTYEGSLKQMKGAWKNFLATGETDGLVESVDVYAENLDKKLKELTPKIVTSVKQLMKDLPPKLKPLIEDGKKLLSETFDAVFGDGFSENFMKALQPLIDIGKFIIDKAKKLNGNKKDYSWLGYVLPGLFEFAVSLKLLSIAIKGVKGISAIFGFVGKIGGLFGGLSKASKEGKHFKTESLKDMSKKFITLGLVVADIWIAAKALQEVKKIGDFNDLQSKLLVIAEAIAGMGILVVAAQKVAKWAGGDLDKGLANITWFAGDIWLVAKALQEVGEIDGDFWSIQSKIGQIALAITEIGGLAVIIGAVVDTGVGAEVIIAGLVSILGIIGTLWLVAKMLGSIQNTKLNDKKIGATIGIIKGAIQSLLPESFGEGLKDFEKSIVEFLDAFIQSGIIGKYIDIAKKLKEIQDIKLDGEKIGATIGVLKDSINLFSGDDDGFWSKVGKIIKDWLDKNDMGQIKQLASDYAVIAGSLAAIQNSNLNKKSLNDKIGIIIDAIESLTGFATDDIADNLVAMSDALDGMLSKLTKKFPPEFRNLGKTLAEKMSKGFKRKLDLFSSMNDEFRRIAKTSFGDLANSFAETFNKKFEAKLNLASILKGALKKALDKDYTTDVKITVKKIRKKAKELPPGVAGPPEIVRASGGAVTSPDGAILKDSPERPFLQNGEYVVPKRIVDKLGIPFFDKLKSGAMTPTFARLAQNVSNTTSSVVNNIYNNTNQTQHMNVYTTGNQDLVLAANRRLRIR